MSNDGAHALFPVRDRWRDLLTIESSGSQCDGAEDRCLAVMMQGIGAELGAEALLVEWFPSAGTEVALYLDDQCRADSALRLLLHEAAAQLANESDAARSVLIGERSSDRGLISVLAFFVGDGIVAISSVAPPAASANASNPTTLASFAPMLRPFFQLWEVSRSQRLRTASLSCAMEHCDTAMFIVDRRSRVVFANTAAEALSARRDGIVVSRGRLVASTLADTMRLEAAIQYVCHDGRDNATVLPIVAVQRSCGRPLMVTAVPVSAEKATPDERSTILYAFDPEEDLSNLIEPACRFYGLSAGETRLTCRLANGGSLVQAAEALGVREQTARSYLKQIFLKTQTNRQAELVWLMLKSAVRITKSARMRIF